MSSAFAEWADRLAHDLSAISEPIARERRVVEWLREMDPGYAVRVLAAVIDRAHGRSTPAQRVLHALVGLRRYETELGYQRLSELYRHADDFGLSTVKDLLLEGRPQRFAPGRGSENEHLEKTLGERKALATTRDRDVLDRLLFDRHPHVIRILLKNRRLVESDVVRLAARRPASPEVLREIVQAPSWIARYRVKLALVCNPYTPTNVALSLLGFLLAPDLRAVAASSTLAKEVRTRAAAQLSSGAPLPS
ncbi:MAG: hypothetical protein IT381_04995 [Deltaproteobacteria bacterium]|nr:hypothetical protein [Deltaproteobacteria bacterium]